MYTCDICRKGFTNNSNLKRHVENVHNKNHQCKFCDRTFAQKSNLKRHIDSQHREVPKIPPLRLQKTSNGQWTTAGNYSSLNETEDLTKVLKSVRPALHR